LRLQLPPGQAIERWERAIANRCAVLNEDRWNHNFPNWPVNRIAEN